MTTQTRPLTARLGISGTLRVKRANGETVDIHVNESMSLAKAAGISEEQAAEVVRQHQQLQQEKAS